MTPDEDRIARRFKSIAETVREKLEKLNIKSSNKFWNINKKQTSAALTAQRPPEQGGTGPGYQSYQDCANIISTSRVGNCGEKGMAYAWWASQSPIVGAATRIYTVTSNPHWDHMWAVMCLEDIDEDATVNVSDFGKLAIMMDGWSEDWYFPNMDRLDRIRLNVWRCETPFALWVRGKVQSLSKITGAITVNGVVK